MIQSNKIYFLILKLFISSTVLCQNDEVPFTSTIIEAVVSVTSKDKIDKEFFGTGFFFEKDSNIYLITAAHVLFEEENDTFVSKSKEWELSYYTRDSLYHNYIIGIDIDCLQEMNNVRFSKTDDVVMLMIGKMRKSGTKFWDCSKFISEKGRIPVLVEEFFLEFKDVGITNDIFTVGFPKSLQIDDAEHYNFNFPLIRKGIVAGKSIDNDIQTIVIDTFIFPGNSGSPVYKWRDMLIQQELWLIGIAVEFIPYEEIWENSFSKIKHRELYNSGYSVVLPIDRIQEIIDVW